MGAIFRRELGAYFTSSVAYVFMVAFYFLAGWLFSLSTLGSGTSDMSGFFSSIFLVIVILIPVLTMKTFSEEKKQKTDQGLLTAPVGLPSIVLGKYLAVLVMYLIGISIVLVYALILSGFGTVDWVMVLSNYLTLVIVGAAFTAIGMFISSLTENQAVAAIGGIITLMFLYLLDTFAALIDISSVSEDLNSFLNKLLTDLSFYNKYYEFTLGIFNLSSVLFYVSTAVIFNFLTIRVLEKRRWA